MNDLACFTSLSKLLLAVLLPVEGQITILLFMSGFTITVTELVLHCLREKQQRRVQTRNHCYLWRKRCHCELEHLKCTYPSFDFCQSEQIHKWNFWVSAIADKAAQRQLYGVRKNVSVLSTCVGTSQCSTEKAGLCVAPASSVNIGISQFWWGNRRCGAGTALYHFFPDMVCFPICELKG